MCGINGMFLKEPLTAVAKERFYRSADKISHRGPDRGVTIALENPINAMIDFKRLSIMDKSTKADQPFRYEVGNRTVYTMCNGEIYNHQELKKQHGLNSFSGSDCEVISLLYQKYNNVSMCSELNSEHAFAILDIDMDTGDYKLILSSDRFGIRPLFVATDKHGFYFSSELIGIPCLDDPSAVIERFKPRNYAVLEKKNGVLKNLEYYEYYNLVNNVERLPEQLDVYKSNIRDLLTDAVNIRMMSDRPCGCLLSGGLDSSLVAGLASAYMKSKGQKLRTFSIGIPGGTDEIYAKMVAEHIGSIHTHILSSEKEFLESLEEIVRTTGSYDVTTVRASTGQYLIGKWISKNTDIKVLLCGDFSDELMGSYKYFRWAPSGAHFRDECTNLLNNIHLYDGLRADRCISGWGLEARFPFADYRFIDYVTGCNTDIRMSKGKIEKWLLRESFVGDLLPKEVLYRSKEAFSDGVSSHERSWYTIIQEYVDNLFTNNEFIYMKDRLEHLKPFSKEAVHYRLLFRKYYGYNENVAKTIPYYWQPKWCLDKDGNAITEPSARVLGI